MKQSTKNPLLMWAIILIVILAVGIGIFVYRQQMNSSPTNTGTGAMRADGTTENTWVSRYAGFSNPDIDPNKFVNLKEYLKSVKLDPALDLDLTSEDFIISVKIDGNDTYIPFSQVNLDSEKFTQKDSKNEAILDIYTAIKNKSIYHTGTTKKVGVPKISLGSEVRHPGTKAVQSILSLTESSKEILAELEGQSQLNVTNRELLAYLYDLYGNYDKSSATRAKLCTDEASTCKQKIEVTFTGSVIDADGKALKGATVSLLNNPAVQGITDEKGHFNIVATTSQFSRLRIKATKDGYSDGFQAYEINFMGFPEVSFAPNFTLTKAGSTLTITPDQVKDGYYTFKTAQSTYRLPVDGLFYADGTPYTGKEFQVYLYEFNKWSKIDDLVHTDTFDPIYGYVGGLMKTFGMPYIQFYDTASRKELLVHSDKPMLLTNTIYHMKELYSNYDKIYEAITAADMARLVAYSKEKGGYPIDRAYLISSKTLRWPAWWVLDRKRGVWENVGMRVVDTAGVIETVFYSINTK